MTTMMATKTAEGPATGNGARRRMTARASRLAVVALGAGLTLQVLGGSWWWALVRVIAVGVGLWGVQRVFARGSAVAAGVLATGIGLLTMAGGVALTVSFQRAGWSVRLVGAILTLVGGATIFVLGAAALSRAVRGWWRLGLVPAVGVVAYGLALPLAVAVYATNVGRPALGDATPADRGLVYVDASFTARDGVQLAGWYIPSTNGAAVVVLHGASSTRTAVLDQAAVLAHHGYGVLLYDAAGMGRSGGRAMNLGWYGDRDLSAALDYLAARPDIDPARIAALGESMGGEQAIGAMAADGRLRAVIAEGATNRVAADWAWLADAYGLRGRVQQGVHWLTTELTGLLTDAPAPIPLRDAVAAADRPLLLITAGDLPDEGHAARSIQQGAPAQVDIWTVPGAGHTGGLRTQPEEWTRRVTTFLHETLG